MSATHIGETNRTQRPKEIEWEQGRSIEIARGSNFMIEIIRGDRVVEGFCSGKGSRKGAKVFIGCNY